MSAAERLRARVGRAGEERSASVEAAHVRRFAEAVGLSGGRPGEAPPTFVVALGEAGLELPEALEYGTAWINGGDRFEFGEPVRVGDVIRLRSRLEDVYERRGSRGAMLFLVFATDYVNQRGALVARWRGTRMRR